MADGIRLRVWLLSLSPFLLVAVAAGAVWLAWPTKPERARHAAEPESPATTAEREPPSAQPTVVATAPATMSSPPPPVAPSVSVAAAAVRPEASMFAAPPEPIPELAAISSRPSGSEQWSPDEKQAYRDRVMASLDDRQRILERELATARRAGDSDTAARKEATLEYLRRRIAKLESGGVRMAPEAGGSP